MLTSLFPFSYVALKENQSGDGSLGESFSPVKGKFVPNAKILEMRNKLIKFMEDHIYPMESEFNKLALSNQRWTVHPEEERLKELAKKEGLWNLWIPVCVSFIQFKLYLFIFNSSYFIFSTLCVVATPY